MPHIILLEPEIAPNTGNIARLCAATGTRLHLVGRLGFRLDARSVRRAGVDCWDRVDLVRHDDWPAFLAQWDASRLWLFSARTGRRYTEAKFAESDGLVFGCESAGLPKSLLNSSPDRTLTIPMPGVGVRSLNLATAVGIALFESLRQIHRW